MTPATRYTPYDWALHPTRIGYNEPGRYHPRAVYDFDVESQHHPLFLEGFWCQLYGQDPNLKAQEN